MKTRIFTLSLMALFAAFTVTGQSVGSAAPDFNVTLSGGGEFSLSDHQGKVVMIFFFGNGCPYCISSGPEVQGIYNTYKSDADFVAVGLDTWNSSSSEESVSGFQAETGLTFPLALSAGAVEDAYNTTYDRLAVVDREGVLRHKGTVAAINDIDNTSSVIAGLLNETDIREQPGDAGVQVFPNPASERIYLYTGSQFKGERSLSIFDISGKQVLQNSYADHKSGDPLIVETDDLNEGLYIFRMESEKVTQTGRFIVDHRR